MRDLISDVSYCLSAVFVRYVSYNTNDVRASSCISLFYKLWIPFVNNLLGKIHVKLRLIFFSSPFQIFNYDLIVYT